MRITVEALKEPGELLVNQPGEKLHRREIAAGTGYTFECVNGTVIGFGVLPAEQVHPDSLNQRPSPNSKAHPGQTSITSGLQPEDPSVTAQREKGMLPYDADVQSPFAAERGRAGPAAERQQEHANLEQAKQDGPLNEDERKALEEADKADKAAKEAGKVAQEASQRAADKAGQEGEQSGEEDSDQRKGRRASRG